MGVDQTEPEVPEEAVGRRVSCGGERATVRYVGPVPPTAGLWLGVEWDDPDRGKHDGSHEGVQYFTCSHTKGGSFVRPAKASFGVDYLAAVRQVYQVDTEEVLSEEISISDKKLKWWCVEERSYESLPSVILSRCEVNGPGDDGEIKKTTPNVQWLDMSGTLLSCWEDVAAVTQQLERLEGLQLSNNRLRLTSDPSTHCQAFCNIKVLALNSCDLTWPQILHCAPMWPQLEDLCVEENNITELQRPEDVLQSLKSLSLSSNPLVQESVLSLSALPRLEQLNLSNTGLSVIRFDDAAPGAPTEMFPALKKLSLDRNNITEWCVVDELAKLRSLVQFSCRGNRLTSSDRNPKTANQILIAKLGRLVLLNSCEPEDRKGAELDYIKMFGEEWLKAGGRSQASAQFISQHPRYQTLIDKYGAPEEGELKKPEPFALKNQLLKITFVFPDAGERKPIEKKLPATMEVQKVKGLLYRLLKVPVADLKLTYTSPKMVGTEFEIDSDLKTLQFYSIEDGNQVLVRWS
ncbi:tubulin-specific chaperone E isoform X2 [Seriola lalandi dorsalis]|uniref:tubulin-specific chaperone E isoform X2 n=1 Tax=Seriola lalandi dorsalis TaxID=1841481 RepID=UPI000C6FC2D3|nr:tubulin-specific chaperone E isoform X2 [Seriola lalandi dorsalis]